jgi:hypothetical protein
MSAASAPILPTMGGGERAQDKPPLALLATTISVIEDFRKSCDVDVDLSHHKASFRSALLSARKILAVAEEFLKALRPLLARYANEPPEHFPFFVEILSYIKDDAVMLLRTVEEVLPVSGASKEERWQQAAKSFRSGITSSINESVANFEERLQLLRSSPICDTDSSFRQPCTHDESTDTKVCNLCMPVRIRD